MPPSPHTHPLKIMHHDRCVFRLKKSQKISFCGRKRLTKGCFDIMCATVTGWALSPRRRPHRPQYVLQQESASRSRTRYAAARHPLNTVSSQSSDHVFGSQQRPPLKKSHNLVCCHSFVFYMSVQCPACAFFVLILSFKFVSKEISIVDHDCIADE